MDQPPIKSCWIVTDGSVGNEKQCLAIAHYLGVTPEVFRVVLREPWNTLAPHFRQGGRRAIAGPLRPRLDGPLPDLLITAGRRSTLVSTTIRRLGGGQTFTVHILDPRIDTRHFDLVICPRHDQLEGNNVLPMRGAPHTVDDDSLSQGRLDWPQIGELPAPRVALLIGASNRAYKVDQPYLERLVDAAEQMMGETGSILVTTSGRTRATSRDWIRQRFESRPGQIWTGESDGPNPYTGYLAWADRFIVTPDSVNMISEACGTGKPVHCETPGPGTPKFQRFHQGMRDEQRVLGLDLPDARAAADPLRETRAVAQAIAERFAQARPRS